MLRRCPLSLRLFGCAFLLCFAFGCGGATNNSGQTNSGGNNGSGGTSQAPPPPPIAVSVTPASVTLTAGATQQFKGTVTGTENIALTWEVNGVTGGNSQVGSISTAGLYTAPATDVQMQVTVAAVSVADSSKSATAAVTVNPPPPPVITVAISPTAVTMAVSTTQQFTATVTGTMNTAVTWSVDGINGGNSAVGTVSTAGLYTAPSSAGTHTVTATSVADSTKQASAAVTLASLIIYPQKTSIAPQGTRQFTAQVQGLQNNSVTWSVDGVTGGNSSVGTITVQGMYTAPANNGTHTVTATAVALPTYSVNASASIVTPPPGVTPVLTYHNDDARDGANVQETTLNPDNVNSNQFGKIAAFPVDGQIYAQPLYVPNLKIGGVQHNVVFVATENDSVYAFDANDLSDSALWKQHLGTAVPINDKLGIEPLLGITSTPVIDSSISTMYVLTEGVESSKKVYRLHALDLATGQERFGGPVVVTGKVPGTGYDSQNGEITLEDSCYQRSGLALDPSSNAVYISFSHCKHGWVLAYDKSSLQQTAIYNDTADGAGGSIWGGGGAPAIDDNTGDLYIMTGTDFGDPAPGYNNSFIRLQASDLSLLDYFKPSNDGYLRENDADLGSGADIVMPDNSSQYPHELIGGGKDGRIFVLDRDDMGEFQITDHVIQEVQTGVTEFDNMYDTPTFWNGILYYHCANDVVKSYNWDSSTGLISTTPISKGTKVYGVHGATASLSANGSSDAVLWEIESTAYPNGGAAILRAYDAKNLSTELYDSTQAGTRDQAGMAIKFAVPTVADGHVYIGTGTELDMYGLLSQ